MGLTTEEKLKDLKKLAHRVTTEEQIEAGFAALESTGLDRDQIEDIARDIGLEGEDMALSVATALPHRRTVPILAERSTKAMLSPPQPNEQNDGFADRECSLLSKPCLKRWSLTGVFKRPSNRKMPTIKIYAAAS